MNPMRMASAMLMVVSLTTMTATAAPPPGKGHSGKEHAESPHGGHGGGAASDGGALVEVSIGTSDARRIALQHGYTGYADLPPGIRKNLARGKPLPPGIAKKAVPGPMLQGLPRYEGYEWQVCGSDLVLVQIATAVIADVLAGVFD